MNRRADTKLLFGILFSLLLLGVTMGVIKSYQSFIKKQACATMDFTGDWTDYDHDGKSNSPIMIDPCPCDVNNEKLYYATTKPTCVSLRYRKAALGRYEVNENDYPGFRETVGEGSEQTSRNIPPECRSLAASDMILTEDADCFTTYKICPGKIKLAQNCKGG
jgi:hypothetical protein